MAAKKQKTAKKAGVKATNSGSSVAADVIASLPLLTGAERAELLQQFTDEQCEAWADRTRSADTLRDTNKWLVTLKAVVLELAPQEYHATRLAFLAELVLALEASTVAPVPGAATASERDVRDAALLHAQGVRSRLLKALSRTAGGRVALRKKISAATGDARTASSTLGSLAELLTVARAEQTASPVASKVSGLTAALVSQADQALLELRGAAGGANSAVIAAGDSAETNRLEGRILRELRLAWQSLRDARGRDGRVPALVPGPALVKAFRLADAEEKPAPA